MEDVLDVYTRPHDPRFPRVCMDGLPAQLLKDVRAPWPARPGAVGRSDYEDEREGTASVFLFREPLQGRRWTAVTERRTRAEGARQIQGLADGRYPDAARVRLVRDNLNTPTPGSLYGVSPPAEAKRLADKLESHHTPEHGSRPNIAEIELSALRRQCLDRRNGRALPVDWRFTTDDARIKLKRLYPKIQE